MSSLALYFVDRLDEPRGTTEGVSTSIDYWRVKMKPGTPGSACCLLPLHAPSATPARHRRSAQKNEATLETLRAETGVLDGMPSSLLSAPH